MLLIKKYFMKLTKSVVWPLKFIFYLLIIIYQKTISKILLPRCRFYPSCSEYGKVVLLNLPLYIALWLILKRLLRCHPWNCGGIDEPPTKVNKNIKL
jgi:uncharacterized protein